MKQSVMKLFIKILAITLFIANLLLAQEDNSSEKIHLSYEKKYLLDKDYENSKSKKFITAEYCISSDAAEGWKLLSYERFVPLAIKIQTEGFNYTFTSRASFDADIKFSSPIGFSTIVASARCNKDKWCRNILKINEEYNIYDIFDVLYIDESLQKIDSAQISTLFGKVFPIKWEAKFDIDGQPHSLSGSYNIKISGMCSKEQLKKIEEKKKVKEK
jgi:hypothetical protein